MTHTILVKNNAEKAALIAGVLLWVVGDLVTTYIGFSVGLRESNIPTQNFLLIALLKFVGALIIVSFVSHLNARGWNGAETLKPIPYLSMILVGLYATVGNSIAIIGVI